MKYIIKFCFVFVFEINMNVLFIIYITQKANKI